MTGGVFVEVNSSNERRLMVHITVKLNVSLRKYRTSLKIDEELPISIPSDTTLAELVEHILQIPGEEVAIHMVNGIKSDIERVLVEGDKVAFWPPVAGG